MIPVLATEESAEAHRILAGLSAAGIDAQLVEELNSGTADDVALVHFSCLGRLARPGNPPKIIAFGGADRADVAVKTLRDGASEYVPAGANIEQISASIQAYSKRRPDNRDAVAASAKMQSLLTLAQRVAQADIAVLISGESGTGKEVIARFIHESSARAQAPFIAVNCAAIPETMLEAVLFGHEKGAFTGAAERRAGKFELADGGTLLLDEITEMPVALQAKLLRVLQEREVERIGSNKPQKVDVRVLATSNRDLSQAVAEGVLREDLYYRLSVFPLQLPPLRERREDIVPLAEHFIAKHATLNRPMLALEAQNALNAHPWPGNVRELENCMQRALVLCNGAVIGTHDLGLQTTAAAASRDADESLHAQMRSSEEQLLLKTLNENAGVRKTTAAQLGISERTLRYKLKQLRERGCLD